MPIRRHAIAIITLTSVAWIACLLLAHALVLSRAPRISEVRSGPSDASMQEVSLPLAVPSDHPTQQLHVVMDIPSPAPGRYLLHFQGCLARLRIDEVPVEEAQDLCERGTNGVVLGLGNSLTAGRHRVDAVLEQRPNDRNIYVHTFDLRIARGDPALLFPLLIALLATLGLIAIPMLLLLPRTHYHLGLLAILLLAVTLRIVYTSATPYPIRSYDWRGHQWYIDYVAEHLSLPPPDASWESFQPPLYYLAAGAWVHMRETMDVPHDFIFMELQVASVGLSIAAFAFAVWIAVLLFPKPEERRARLLFLLIIVVFPALVFHATRVSNDVPLHTLAFANIAFLLNFWRSGRMRSWIACCACLAIGCLVKNTILPLIAFAAIIATLQPRLRLRHRIILIALLLTVTAATVVSLHVARFGWHAQTSLVGNAEQYTADQYLPPLRTVLLRFNPLHVLQSPYASDFPAAAEQPPYWEYVFKSAHAGSFALGEPFVTHTMLLHLAGLLLLPIGAWGLAGCFRPHAQLFPLVLLCVSLLAHLAFRAAYPFAACQDIRFVVFIILPLSFFFVRGLERLRGAAHTAGLAILLSYAGLAGSLLLKFAIF